MRMLAGYLAPSAGTARIMGLDVRTQRQAVQQNIGYLAEGAPCYPEMTVQGFLSFIAKIRGFSGAECRRRVAQVMAQLELEGVKDQSIETLSKGFRRRVGLAQAILHDPPVLILDEPTDGLDPNQKHQVRDLIRSLPGERTVIISTHILEEVDALCTHAIIINQGQLVAQGTPLELESQSRYHQAVTLVADEPLDEQALLALPNVVGLEHGHSDNSLIVLAAPDTVIYPQISALIRQRGWSVRELDVEKGRLEDVFRTLTRGAAS